MKTTAYTMLSVANNACKSTNQFYIIALSFWLHIIYVAQFNAVQPSVVKSGKQVEKICN